PASGGLAPKQRRVDERVTRDGAHFLEHRTISARLVAEAVDRERRLLGEPGDDRLVGRLARVGHGGAETELEAAASRVAVLARQGGGHILLHLVEDATTETGRVGRRTGERL